MDNKNQITHLKQIHEQSLAKSPQELTAMVAAAVEMVGADQFRSQAAQALDEFVCPSRVVPNRYREYKPVVRDGIRLFLSRLSVERLTEILVSQLLMAKSASSEERLVALAKQIPTLHKLGQIIARNRNVDILARKWLISLENGQYGTDITPICRQLIHRLGQDLTRFSIDIATEPLSEASVGVVIPFHWIDPSSSRKRQGVFKIIKSNVQQQIDEEIEIFEFISRYFQDNRKKYDLNNLGFIDIFEDVKAALLEEVDLLGEQRHLWDANQFYEKDISVKIPKLVPFSSKHVTAMSYMPGMKITDLPMSTQERKSCAVRLYETLICRPLFSRQSAPLFHGDPHAGNIFSNRPSGSGEIQTVLLDWSLAGRLHRKWRLGVLQLVQAIIRENADLITQALCSLTSDAADDATKVRIRTAYAKVIGRFQYASASVVKKTFMLLDRVSLEGVLFPKDLMLFRKAFFTLEGVLSELDPEFPMDTVTMKYIFDLIMAELPRRIANVLMPIFDSPEKYQSMMSNRDLQLIFTHQALAFVKRNTDFMVDFFENNLRFFLQLAQWPLAGTVKMVLGMYYLANSDYGT